MDNFSLVSNEFSLDCVAPIVTTVGKLHPEERDLSEKILLEASHDLELDVVRRLCARTLEASAAADTADERRERQQGSRYLRLVETWQGMTRIDGMLTAEQGAALRAVIEPLAQHLGAEDDRAGGQRRAGHAGPGRARVRPPAAGVQRRTARGCSPVTRRSSRS